MASPPSQSPGSSADQRLAGVLKGIEQRANVFASLIFVATALTSDLHLWTVAGVLALLAAAVGGNTWLSHTQVPKLGGNRAEDLRILYNVLLCVCSGGLTGWASAVWLWLPYQALVTQLGADRSRSRYAVFLAIFVVAALAGGADPLIAALWLLASLMVHALTSSRFTVIFEMLADSERQARELKVAHAEVADAHARLLVEMKDRQRMELELRQAQKLEAVGRLASGIAHEINTPVQFVSDSVKFLQGACSDVIGLLERYRALALERGADLASALDDADADADLEYLRENVPGAFNRSLDGLNRIAALVRSMKEFAHPDAKTKSPADLNRAVESTLTMARNEYKYVAELKTDFGALPPVTCLVSEVNQAVLNIVVNAAHAIADRVKGTDRKGLIEVTTRVEGDEAVIAIKDDGGGIPEAIRDRIFDPFFTTKALGKGTGQGLAISRSVIVDKHQGSLTFEVDGTRGTTFTIRLPVEPRIPASAPAPVH